MSTPLGILAERIRSELWELNQVLARLYEAWQRASRSGDELYLDSVALNLHGFYSGIERIFEQLAERIDGNLPNGENWHQALLVQMTKGIVGIRPAVISQDTSQRLNEYRGFRHVVRNVYTFHFEAVKMEKLVVGAPYVFEQVQAELLAFARFLDAQI